MAGGLFENQQIGKREALLDLMVIIDWRKTPVFGMIKKRTDVQNTQWSWLLDKHATPKFGGVVDGTDVDSFDNAAKDRARQYACTQTFRRTFKVSRKAERISKVAGVPSELQLAKAKQLYALKTDVEATICGDQELQLDDGSNPGLMRSLGYWIRDTANISVQTQFQVPANYRPAAAQYNTTATASLAEDTDLQGFLQSVYDATGMAGDYKFLAGSDMRRAFTNMTRHAANAVASTTKTRMFNEDLAGKSISDTTTVFQGDYGTLEVLSTNFNGFSATSLVPEKGRGFCLDFDTISLVVFWMPELIPVEDKGGGPRGAWEMECGLQVDNPVAQGQFNP